MQNMKVTSVWRVHYPRHVVADATHGSRVKFQTCEAPQFRHSSSAEDMRAVCC